MPGKPPQRVCFFGTYQREHIATRLLLNACRAAGIEVIECHRALWEKTQHKHAAYFGVRSVARLAAQYAVSAVALARHRRSLGDVPLYVVGFNGQLDCLWLRLLLRQRTPIVFAPLVTLTETLVEDRSVLQPGSAMAHGAAWLDRMSLSLPAHVIMDTEAHCRYVTQTFSIPAPRLSTWYLGADTTAIAPTPLPPATPPLRVLFYGSFLPLHGTRTVLQAAALLQKRADIEIVMLGGGLEHAADLAYARAAGLTRVRFLDWMSYERLNTMIASAHICLGIFGTSAKAQMVIPNKVYEAAAAARPIITAATSAVREVFTHDESVWLCPAGDPQALAAAIETLAGDARLRERLAAGAAALMTERFSAAAQGQKLAAIFAAATTPA